MRSIGWLGVWSCWIGLGFGIAWADFQVGTAEIDITPPRDVVLWGQFHARFSTKPDTPLTANVIALQSSDERTTLVSLDLLQIPDALLQAVREAVAQADASIPTEHILLAATHTHTAPVLEQDVPAIPEDGKTMTVAQTYTFLADRICQGIVAAWKDIAPGSMAYGLDRNSIGFGRRAVYADGTAVMYGATNQPNFENLEGMDDDDIGAIFFFGADASTPKAILVNVACPSQVVEGNSQVNADYWQTMRKSLKKTFGSKTVIAGFCSAAGDLSPRPILHREANMRMLRLRGISEMDEITRRLSGSVRTIYDTVAAEKDTDPILRHTVRKLELPLAPISEAAYQKSKAEYAAAQQTILEKQNQDVGAAFMSRGWYGDCVRRYELLQKNPNATCTIEIHVVRLGDCAICSNPFELFTEYGIRIKARSTAVQTLIVQLAGFGSYLPTQRAIDAGGYSAVPQSNVVGPVGGQKLVDETVREIEFLFEP